MAHFRIQLSCFVLCLCACPFAYLGMACDEAGRFFWRIERWCARKAKRHSEQRTPIRPNLWRPQ